MTRRPNAGKPTLAEVLVVALALLFAAAVLVYLGWHVARMFRIELPG